MLRGSRGQLWDGGVGRREGQHIANNERQEKQWGGDGNDSMAEGIVLLSKVQNQRKLLT
jgi:hypothetical protein